MQPGILTVLADTLRVLTFRKPSPAIAEHWKTYLAVGLIFTWIAGVGRYWDNPRAFTWQYLGLGSVGYVFVLALILWVVIMPLRPKRWSYRNVLIFLTLTSPPAILYAIPVEQFMLMSDAKDVNAWFLALIAVWRVSLLVWFLRMTSGLSDSAVAIATLLPMVLIILLLAALNLEHVVFATMRGSHEEHMRVQSQNDVTYIVVLALTILSGLAAPFLLIAYAKTVYSAWYPKTTEPSP